MASRRSQPEITSVRVPPDEAAEMAALAAALGTSRSRLLRVGFAAIASEDPDLLRTRLTKLPADRRSTWRLTPRTAEEVAAAP